jgi:hypothetical protein
MSLTPQISLTITLDDFSGVEIGSTGAPAYVQVALCGYGPSFPRVPGTAILGKVMSAAGEIPYEGAPIVVELFGNDVIVPSGTYYTFTILDAKRNVLQCNAYQFSGTVSADLSTITPISPSSTPSVIGILVTVPFSATPVFQSQPTPVIAFDLTLTGNVTSSTLNSPFPGQIVTFIISQNATGGWTFAWPSNVKNAGIINPAPNSVTTQSFITRANGNLYPIGPQTYS